MSKLKCARPHPSACKKTATQIRKDLLLCDACALRYDASWYVHNPQPGHEYSTLLSVSPPVVPSNCPPVSIRLLGQSADLSPDGARDMARALVAAAELAEELRR
jgi:hypothetical protein